MLFKEIVDFNFSKYKDVHFILGENPSKGARSPKLWNFAFNKFKINSIFIPLDIKKNEISKFVKVFKQETKFKSFLITNPYKEKIVKYADYLDKRVSLCNAANFILKKKKILKAYNTDCLGFYYSLNKLMKKKTFFVYGYGGVGKAIVAELVSRKKSIYLFNRSRLKIKKQKNILLINKENFKNFLMKTDIFINASSLGNLKLRQKSPLKNIEISWLINKYIFDVNFKPKITKLNRIASTFKIKNQNGKAMNLFQACEAFKKAYPKYQLSKIKNIMMKVK